MKSFFTLILISASTFFSVTIVCAQTNTFPTSGNAGVGTISPTTTLQVVGTSTFGSIADYTQFSTDGDLKFTGNADYLVSANKYAFRYSANQSIGFYFSSTNGYEFRDASGAPAGFLTSLGTFYIKSKIGINNTSPSASLDITPASSNAINIKPFGTSAGNTGEIRLNELVANGTNYIGFKSPDNITTNKIWTLPSTDGTSGQALTTNGSGILSWTTISGGSGGANTSLNNLVTTSVNQSLIPSATNTMNLGSASLSWKNIYSSGVIRCSSFSGIGKREIFADSVGNLVLVPSPSPSSVSNTTAQSIPDFTCTPVTSTITLSGLQSSVSSESITVTITVTHPAVQDLDIFLQAPDGSTINLVKANINGANLISTSFNDAGSLLSAGVAPYSGSFKPYGSLLGIICGAIGTKSTFGAIGGGTINPNGTWTLTIYDHTFGNTGTLNSWSVAVATTTGATGSWSLKGNSGTGPDNFLGTTDNHPLTLKVNNSIAGIIDYSSITGITSYGFETLKNNSSGKQNTACGFQAMYTNTGGNNNSALGRRSLYSNSSGLNNVAIGCNALYSNTTGHENTAVGAEALYSNTYSAYNTANGYQALYSNSIGQHNTAIGYQALFANTDNDNTANGYKALYSNNDGEWNTGIGKEALSANTSGDENTAVGNQALFSNTEGFGNVAQGFQSLYSNIDGGVNTALGDEALFSNTSGSSNIAIGVWALESNTEGEGNTACGSYAGFYCDKSTYCTFIGYQAQQGVDADYTNSTSLGHVATISADNEVRIGNSSVTTIGGYTNWSNVSDGRYKNNIEQNVPGLEFIDKLTPITYTLDVNGIAKFLGEDNPTEEAKSGADGKPQLYKENEETQKLIQKGRDEKSKIVYTGFIAQDVEKAANEIGYDFSGVDKPQNEHGLYGLRYAEFVVPLVKAVQELDSNNNKLHNKLTELQTENAALIGKNDELQKQIDALNEAVFENRTSDCVIKFETAGAKQETTLLGQNIPNPFDHSTLIPFRIPKDCKDASIAIAEISTGKIVRAIPIACGETQLTIEEGILAAGTYSYSLIVNGSVIDTKEMTLIR